MIKFNQTTTYKLEKRMSKENYHLMKLNKLKHKKKNLILKHKENQLNRQSKTKITNYLNLGTLQSCLQLMIDQDQLLL
jgi:hypothetical protein